MSGYKIKVFGEAIVRNITFLDGGAAFESKEISEGGFGKPHQEPGQAVIPFQNSFGNTAAAFPGKAIRQ